MIIRNNILSWHIKTFPNATRRAVLLKLKEECIELIKAIDSNDNADINDEMADVRIVMEIVTNNLSQGQGTLDLLTLKKMDINKNRIWGTEDKNGDKPRNRNNG